MQTLSSRTARIHRQLIDRLRGMERLYETKLTDGYRSAFGRGQTREASEQSAQRTWDAKFGPETES
jgi:hypothetical protein